MTAGEIIDEIEQLAPSEQARVSRGAELTLLAAELVGATPAEAEMMKARIEAGFFGEDVN